MTAKQGPHPKGIIQPVPSESAPSEAKAFTSASGPIFYPVELPSKGHFGYPSTVQYRDILVRDEKILSTATRANYIQTLNKILKSLLGDPAYYDDLTVYDRDFLLLWIWANNYSPIKKIQVTCANDICEHEDTVEVDLTKLEVTDVDPTLPVPFRMVIDNSDKEINLRLITVGDQAAMTAFVKDHPDYDDDTVLYSLTMDIGAVMPLDRKIRWIEDNIRGKTMALVRAFHEHYRYGVKDRLQHTCTVCAEVTHYRLPFRPEWLRPTVQDDFEKMLRANGKPASQPC